MTTDNKVAVPDFQTLMLPVLKLGATGEIQLKDAIETLSDEFHLSQEEREHLLPSGAMTTIRNRVAWAVSYLVQAKLLQRPKRGFFTVSERGQQVLTNPPSKVDIKFLEQYPEFLEFRNKKKSPETPSSTVDEDETATPALQELSLFGNEPSPTTCFLTLGRRRLDGYYKTVLLALRSTRPAFWGRLALTFGQ